MDAVKLLTEDHDAFGRLFKRYRAAQSPRLREDLARRLIREAQLHIALEEKYVYPIAKERSGAELDEHQQAKFALAQLEQMQVEDVGFEERLTSFVDELIAHSREEERLFFPALRKTIGRSEIDALGRLIQNAREARPEPTVDSGLVSRAVSHLLTAWKVQLADAFERRITALIGDHTPSRTSYP